MTTSPILRRSAAQGLLCGLVIVATSYGRTALAPVQEAMSSGLGLADMEVALIQGPAMAIPVVLSAAPFGLLVDRYSRARLMFALVAVALAATVATALADGFTSMVAARCAVGFASAAAATTAISFLSDAFPVEQRGRATMILSFGQMMGNSAAFALGGMFLMVPIGSFDPWRSAMLWAALPMLPVLLSALLLIEPRRPALRMASPAYLNKLSTAQPRPRTLATLVAGIVSAQIPFCAVFIWAAPAFDRSFMLGPDVVGGIIAFALLTSGTIGPLFGGMLAEHLQRTGGLRSIGTGMIWLQLSSLPLCLFGFLSSATIAVVVFVIYLVVITIILIMGMVLFTLVIPDSVRGFSLGLLFSVEALVGFGLAPVLVSGLSELSGGGAAIRSSLAIVAFAAGLLGALALWHGTTMLPGRRNGHELACP